MCDKKCDNLATKLRNDGNTNFNSGKWLEALILYNKSLCYASTKDLLCFVYANRSAVYLKSNLFEKSLENIDLAKKHGYPKEKLQKLNDREQRCKKLMTHRENDPKNFFKLSYAANRKIPFIVDCIELNESPKYGRYIVATRNLVPGDIIAIEEPVFKFVDREVCYRHCSHCLRSNDLSLIPCQSCANGKFFHFYVSTKQVALFTHKFHVLVKTFLVLFINKSFLSSYFFQVMFCSNDCMRKHQDFIHQFECGNAMMPESESLALTMILSAISVAGSVEGLRKLLEGSTVRTVFDVDVSNPDESFYDRNVCLVINSLTTVRETEYTKTGPLDWVLDNPIFSSLLKTDDDRKFMKRFINKQLRILDTNLYDMKEHTRISSNDRPSFGKSIGSGLCLFASLFSHSCDPSVKRITVDNKLAFVVVKPIKAGEQLYISYGYSSYAMNRDERRSYLKSYGFICDCEACVKNYPKLTQQLRKFHQYDEPDHKALPAREAVTEFMKTCSLIQNIISNHPCYETTDMIIYCDHLLHQISKNSMEEIGI